MLGLLAFIFIFFLIGTLVVFYYVRKGINTCKLETRRAIDYAYAKNFSTATRKNCGK